MAAASKGRKKQAVRAEKLGGDSSSAAPMQEAVPVGSSHGETILLDASYSIPAAGRSASQGGARKWLKLKVGGARADEEEARRAAGGQRPSSARQRTSWHQGIFSFRRSSDGAAGRSSGRGRAASEEDKQAEFTIPASLTEES